MAEAFAVAASVAGILSLGLEAFKGISTYLDAARGRGEEISAVHQQIENFQSSLEILKDLLPDIGVKHQVACSTVRAALKSCELELGALKDFVDRLSDSTAQSHRVESHLEHARKKLTFPFQKKRLDRLQKRVIEVNTSLDAAIRVLGL